MSGMGWFRPLGMLWYAAMRIAFRRLWANRTLVAGVTVGFMVAVGATSSVPAFTAGALQRLLQAQFRTDGQQRLTAIHLAHFEQPRRPTTRNEYLEADRLIREEGPGYIGLPTAEAVRYGALVPTRLRPVDPERVNPLVERWMSLSFLSELKDHVHLVAGRFPEPGKSPEGIYEAMVEEEALDKQAFDVGAQFWVPLNRSPDGPRVRVRVVGAFRRTAMEEPYWFQGGSYDQHLFITEETFREQLLREEQVAPGQYSWYFGLESDRIRVTDAVRLLEGLYDLEARVAQVIPDTELFEGPMDLLTEYALQAIDLQGMLLVMTIPSLAVIAYFVAATSSMIVLSQRQEIAVLRSRGASLWQIALIYLSEGVLLAGVGMAGGYPIGILLSRMMGAAVGFLQFVDRQQPPLLLPPAFWLAGVCAGALGILAYLLPALLAARSSIVTYKQESARRSQVPIWARWGLDLLCLALAGYGYYTLSQRAPSPAGDALRLDPLQVIAPALFLAGASLLMLRMIPRAVGLAFRLLDRWSSTPIYLALIQLSRSPGSYAPVILLLTLTVGMGMYNAMTARTLERNVADRIHYAGGADVVLDEAWDYAEEPDPASPTGSRVTAVMPPMWHVHDDLPGVEHAARVRVEVITPSVGGRSQRTAKLVSIDPADFSRVAWFRPDLARAPFHLYLGLLQHDEEAVLVNGEFLRRHNLAPGDRVTLTAEGQAEVSVVLYGALDYFPTLIPAEGDFFIANLDYIEENLGLRPYQVWLKLRPGARVQAVIDALDAHGIQTLRADDHRQRLIQARRDPQVNGLLGGLTNSFLTVATITVAGFLLYASLSIRSRVLQFGLLRAMGLSVSQSIAIVVLEQVFVVALTALLGTGLGHAAARIFIPFLKAGAGEPVPPFVIDHEVVDQLRLYAVLLLMLTAGTAGLVTALRRLRIAEAVKLGEDH